MPPVQVERSIDSQSLAGRGGKPKKPTYGTQVAKPVRRHLGKTESKPSRNKEQLFLIISRGFSLRCYLFPSMGPLHLML